MAQTGGRWSKRRGNRWQVAGGVLMAVVLMTACNLIAPANPYLGPTGTSAMHGDTESSDTTWLPGPGTGPVNAQFLSLTSACPTILEGHDGLIQALCISIATRTPTLELIDPTSNTILASYSMATGNLFGGVYVYLDSNDQVVAIDSSDNLLHIAHDQNGPGGTWRFFVVSSVPLESAINANCGSVGCDSVFSVAPDYQGRIWFGTVHGSVGVYDPSTGLAHTIALGAGELIQNSISIAPEGTAVVTTAALYMLNAGSDDMPYVMWRQPYDRGPGRKPGQLSWGSGSTPTFFGPTDATDYVEITDNAVPLENVLVYDTTTGQPVCSIPAIDGSENSDVGSVNSVYVASTYGYHYPSLPPDAPPVSVPASAPFTGGMVRVDVNPAGNGCSIVWSNSVRSAAVPRLSVFQGKLYTINRIPATGSDGTSALDSFDYVVVDASSGAVLAQQLLGTGEAYDTLQLAPTITTGSVEYLGTVTGIFRISP